MARLTGELRRGSCLLKDLVYLNAAMLLLAAAVTEAEGLCVWVGDSAGGPRLCVRDAGSKAAGAAEVDKIPERIRLSRAAALAFLSTPLQPHGWAQPP